jgi:HrpA-like RNA helicase
VLCKLTDCAALLLHTTYVRINAVECRRVAAVSTAERVAYEMGTACYSSTTARTNTTGKFMTSLYILQCYVLQVYTNS